MTGNDNQLLYWFAQSDNTNKNFRGDADEKLIRVNGNLFTTKNHSTGAVVYDFAYGWLTEDVPDAALYQIPVINFMDLEYGTYNVTIQPRYAAGFDVLQKGYYDVYVDGIRVYDPAGTGDNVSMVVAEAYNRDNERNAVFAEVRDTVIQDTENFLHETSGVGDTAIGGSIMVDGMFVTANSATAMKDLFYSGPSNEMYLAKYQALAFKPAVVSGKAPTGFQVGMKVAITNPDPQTGKDIPSNASVRVIISDVKKQTIRQISTLTVSGAAEQFYDLSSMLSWTQNEEQTAYISDYDVVILNDSDLVLSLTTFKTTFRDLAADETPTLEVVSDKHTLRFDSAAVRKTLSEADTSTFDVSWAPTDLTVGATAVLNVTTSSEITSIMVGGTEITEYTQNADGTRSWTYEFVVQETGEDAYDVILKDAFGRTSQTYTATVPMDETATDEPATEETGRKTFFGKLRAILEWLLNLFRKILSFFGL